LSESNARECLAQNDGGKDGGLKQLEKIARVSGVLPVGLNYRKTFSNCTTTQQKKKKLHQMLKDAGMKGITFYVSDPATHEM